MTNNISINKRALRSYLCYKDAYENINTTMQVCSTNNSLIATYIHSTYGSIMPGRYFSSGTGYRYGFNGKEDDNVEKGIGNQQDYGMRVYDPRLCKFLSVDPLTKNYPSWSPYPFAMNRPIDGVDLDGCEWKSKHKWTDVITDQNHIKTLTAAGIFKSGMTYQDAWNAYSPTILQNYVDQKKVEDCADLAYAAIIDFAAQFELPIYFRGNRPEYLNKKFDNDKMEYKTKEELIEAVQSAFGAGDLAADYGVQHTKRKDFKDLKSGDLISWRVDKENGYHHTQTIFSVNTKTEITANINDKNWMIRNWNELKDLVVSQPKSTTGNVTLVQGNISGASVKAPAEKITYIIDNLKSGITSKGNKEITRHSQWNFGSFDKKGK